MTTHKYLKVYFVNKKKPVILRDPLDALGGCGFIRGQEADEEGQLVSFQRGTTEVFREHYIQKPAILRLVPMKMNRYYGELEEVKHNPVDDQFSWHKKPSGYSGTICPICGCPAKRLRAEHRALRADEIQDYNALWVKRIKVCFGTDTSIEAIRE